MTKFGKTVRFAALAALALSLAACREKPVEETKPFDAARYEPVASPRPAATAVTWYPAADWKDEDDPIASPLAKKGGIIRFSGGHAPKSFCEYLDNNTYTRMTFSLMYETLISTDTETLDFVPGLARRWSVSADGREFTFVIDERAAWSDGEPVTAADVKWTFDTVTDPKNDTGSWKILLGDFESPEILDAHTVRFRKKGSSPKNWRDLSYCGTFYVMPMHYFKGRDFNKVDLLGAPVNGPYKLGAVEEQVETRFDRVKNWWRRDFPSCRYICNFDHLVMRYYADNENAFDAFRKQAIDVYPVYSAHIMNNNTKGEMFQRNWIVKRRVRNHEPIGFQGFAMNMRRFPFDDLKVRLAMQKLVDRETMNRSMMFSEYFMLKSYYTDLYDAEHPCTNPLNLYDPEGAAKLLAEAGFRKNAETGILEKDGRPFSFTFLSRASSEDKFLALFNAELLKLGIEMKIDRKDFAAWMRDMDSFHFDMTWASWGATVFKNPETMFLSSEADRKQSNNTVGFKSAEVDAILKAEKGMMSTAERNEAYRRIDALVAAQCPYALLWNSDVVRLLYWNRFGTPETVVSRYGDEDSVFTYWWYDEDRVKELDRAMEEGLSLPSVPYELDFDEIAGRRK